MEVNCVGLHNDNQIIQRSIKYLRRLVVIILSLRFSLKFATTSQPSAIDLFTILLLNRYKINLYS